MVTPAFASDITPRVVGGQTASDSAWPSMVALVRSGDTNHYQRQFCGGNLIADRWVLTAAHCLFTPQKELVDVSSIRIAYGSNDLLDSQNIDEAAITNFYTHPLYDPSERNAYHDIAVLELAQALTLPTMTPYSGDIDMQVGASVTVTGWGAVTYNNDTPSNFPTDLQQATVPLVSRNDCNGANSYDGIIGPGQICAGLPNGGRDSCVGDSGGPLMITNGGENEQVGIVSFGIGCALAEKYGVYTNVSYYNGWIASVLAGEVEPGTFQRPVDDRRLVGGSGSAGWFGLLTLFGLAGLRRNRVASNNIT